MPADVRELIQAKLLHARHGDYFGVLGVEPDVDDVQLKRAYFELVKLLHPDRIRALGMTGLQADADQVFEAVAEAYAHLGDPVRRARRARELRQLAHPPIEHTRPRARPMPPPRQWAVDELLEMSPAAIGSRCTEAAEALRRHGEKHLEKGEHRDAERLFRKAMELAPDTPLYSMLLGWTLFSDTARPMAERLRYSRPHLEAAAAGDAYNAVTRYRFALYWQAAGKLDRFRSELQAVLRCQPDHDAAKHLLSQLDGTGSKPGSGGESRKLSGAKRRRPGLFDRLRRRS